MRLTRQLHGALAAAVLATTLLAPACVKSIEPDVNLASAPKDDGEYSAALDKATQTRKVFKDFETRYEVTATYLSPEFRGAFTKRLERVYKKGQAEFEEASAKAGFFVVLHAPDHDRTDLTNPHHWTIQMATKDGTALPILVKKLNDKERWRAFFPAVTQWTSEYLVVFDTPAVDANSPQLVEKTDVALTFANADAQVDLAW